MAHVYANRLNEGLKQIIDKFQSAFIKGRSIHNHTRSILDMIDYKDHIDDDSLSDSRLQTPCPQRRHQQRKSKSSSHFRAEKCEKNCLL